MNTLKLLAATAALSIAPFAANAAPCTVGTCEITDGGPLSVSNPIAIQDDDVTPGPYSAEGSFAIAPGLAGADVFVDVAFDEILAGQSAVAAGFSDLTIEFFQGVTSLGSFTVTNSDGTTDGGVALQSFFLSFVSDAAVNFSIDGIAFLNSGAALPDYNFNINAAVSEVPIPAALPLLLSGIAGLGFASRRKKTA
ncbi:VPLPA-CTERM sorting domain-containing protein [Hyphococcus sp. DH-69]|uniref:VPLPA-CTERM sorting domain-containing protein n=1 Tax=Hyphococcus formosus TaxID=3143534 RepID=UPI00398B2B53